MTTNLVMRVEVASNEPRPVDVTQQRKRPRCGPIDPHGHRCGDLVLDRMHRICGHARFGRPCAHTLAECGDELRHAATLARFEQILQCLNLSLVLLSGEERPEDPREESRGSTLATRVSRVFPFNGQDWYLAGTARLDARPAESCRRLQGAEPSAEAGGRRVGVRAPRTGFEPVLLA